METRVRPWVVAITSAATVAVLFTACNGGAGLPVQAPEARPDLALLLPRAAQGLVSAADPGAAQAVQVYQQGAASVVNVTSLAVVRTGQGPAVQPRGRWLPA